MNVLRHASRLPGERGRVPVALAIVVQAAALLALATIVRDQRPDPAMDSDRWENMGMFVEFTSITPLAILFLVVALAGLHAIDSALSASTRARECASILKWFAVGVSVVVVQLVSFGLWKGIWEMLGPMAALALLDLALVFLAFRYLDLDEATAPVRNTVSNRPPR